ncbi:hypothetical protein OTU49_000699 [Cherax quadricarinatus]|uniref:Uncharacterized protein n=1 Tax=Cherax quadricarinatus TaxID=27406 RepID=A0AAW0XYM8_CHEQU|nr:uncharacterized protein LOC128689051 [Cherax quadricarinatus]
MGDVLLLHLLFSVFIFHTHAHTNVHTHAHTNVHTHHTFSHRIKRDLLGGHIHHDQNMSHQKDQDPLLFSDRDTSDEFKGAKSSPSSSNSPPNSWLYKFPPWFLPGNPAPEGFHSHSDSLKISTPEFSKVDDGDVLIIDNFGVSDPVGQTNNVKIPGTSPFRDEVVQTLIDVKFSSGQNPLSQGGKTAFEGVPDEVVTPWLVPQSVPQPPLLSPAPTVPFSFQDDNTGFDNNQVQDRPHQGKFHVGITARRPQSSLSPVFNTKQNLLTKAVLVNPTPAAFLNRGFQPSPPDLPPTVRPTHAAQEKHSPSTPASFRASKLISVTRVGDDSTLGNPVIASQGQQHSVENGKFDKIISDNFFRDQQTVLLKASARSQLSTSQNPSHDNNVGNTRSFSKQDGSLWVPVPFIPGGPVPSLQQHSRRLSSNRNQNGDLPQALRTFAVSNLQLRQQNEGESRPESFHFPTSIQDIINSDSDTAQQLHQLRNPNIPATKSGGTASKEERNDKWFWPTS